MAFSVCCSPSNWTCGVFIKWKRISSSIETRLSWPAARNNMRAAILRVLKGHERRYRKRNKTTKAGWPRRVLNLSRSPPLHVWTSRQPNYVTFHHPVCSWAGLALIPFAKAEFMVERLVGFYILNMYIPTLLGVILRHLMEANKNNMPTVMFH